MNTSIKKPVTQKAGAEMPASSSPSTSEYLTESRLLFLIVAATVLVYANSLSGEFVFDDKKQIVQNLWIHSWSNIYQAFTTDVWAFERTQITNNLTSVYYRPLFTVYLTLGYKLIGLWPAGWHVISLAMHVGVTVAVYYLLKRISGNHLIAALAALIFGVHPAHTESVSWISAIPDPLMAIFYVPSVLWYDKFRTTNQRKYLALSIAAYGIAVFCKETALSLPLLILFWEIALRDDRRLSERVWRAIPLLVPYGIVSVIYLAARVAVLGHISWKHQGMLGIPDYLIWMTVPYAVVNYLYHLIAPFNLSIVYGTSFVKGANDPRFVVPLLILLAIGAIVWFARRRISREIWLAMAFTVAPILPVLNLRVFHEEYVVQDRYLYLPLIGFSWLLAIAILRFSRTKPRAGVAVTVLILALLGAGTFIQNRVWHSSVSLWQQSFRYASGFWSTHYNLGLAYLERGNYVEAQQQFQTALQIRQVPVIYNNLALAQKNLGDNDAALKSLQTALAIDPQSIEARNNLGTFLFQRGDFQAARQQFVAVLSQDPASPAARFNMARTDAALGNHAAAIQSYEDLLAKTPDDAEARFQLALSYAATGQKAKGAQQLHVALAGINDAKRIEEMQQTFEQTHD